MKSLLALDSATWAAWAGVVVTAVTPPSRWRCSAAAAFGVLAGASIIRVHEVQATVRVVRMTEAILGHRPPAATRRSLV
jgi:dihydropteroate synthase